MKYGFGIDLGGTTAKLAFFDETGNLLGKWEIPTDTSDNGSQILPDIAASVRDYLSRHGIGQEQVIGIGLGVPGPVDRKGNVNKCINLGWGRFNVSQTLSRLSGFPVLSGNDANVAAMGEFWKGGGEKYDNMVLATLGTGVGGGIIIEGKLLYGAHGSGGEIGHMVLNRYETVPCNCGKYGCVEQYCSATGLVRLARRELADTLDDSALRQADALTAKAVFDAGKAGDPVSLRILHQYFAYLGEFLANVCVVADPEVVVLGGGVSKAGTFLLDGVRPYFQKDIFHASSEIEFQLATLGNDAGSYGAFKLALDAFG